MYGAAVSTVIGYGLLAILAGWLSQRHYPVPWQLLRAVVILGLAAALSALALLGPDNPLWRVGAILLYPPILIGTGIVRPTQARQLLRALLRR
jgi:peptidoglycan/LPS O-acetylase OafA/YrhL